MKRPKSSGSMSKSLRYGSYGNAAGKPEHVASLHSRGPVVWYMRRTVGQPKDAA